MTSQQIVNLLKLVGTPRDGALLRFSLGSEYLKCAELDSALEHLNAAVEKDPGNSAAWKLLGNTLDGKGRAGRPVDASRNGAESANGKAMLKAATESARFGRC